MSDPTKKQIATAKWLLERSAGRPEPQIQQRISDLLTSLGVDREVGFRTGDGEADIYLPRRRTIIETKALGLADHPDKPQARKKPESPKQQLERYLHSEISREIRSLPFEDNADRPWTGILTDGRVWHVWSYPHAKNAAGTPIEAGFRPGTPEALIGFLRRTLDGDLVGKEWIPSDPRNLFEPRLNDLRAIYKDLPEYTEAATGTKMHLWLDMLRTSSMEPRGDAARHDLFVAHSFLVTLARGVIRALANPKDVPKAKDVLGDGFVAWVIETREGEQWGDAFLEEIHHYEWRRRPGDVLRPLYEQFVDARDRKAFGEFYTPDWLAELIVAEVCDEAWCKVAIDKALVAPYQPGGVLEGVGVLDPTCGSGTFLYHAATRILASDAMRAANLGKSERASVVCALVHGIDVHPVAAEIARATLLRALPIEPPRGEADLHIYEGDALLIRGDDEQSLFRPTNGEIQITTPKGSTALFPRSFVARSDFQDSLRRLVLAAADKKPLPSGIAESLPEDDRSTIQACHQAFMAIIEEEGNSVWTWYIRNTAGPHRLSQKKVDRIVANPPWVKIANIQARKRKRDLESFADRPEIDLWPGGKQAPHLDLAQLFVKRSRQLYLADPERDPAAWLVKKAALRAGSWEKFREWHQKVLKQTLDLEPIQPFGGGDARRCCVLFEGRPSRLEVNGRKRKGVRGLIGTVAEGPRPAPSDSLTNVREHLTFLAASASLPRGESDFVTNRRALFRQGATITPKILTVIDRVEASLDQTSLRVVTARSQHPPWRDIDPQRGEVPKEWVRDLVISKAVLPFAVSPTALVLAVIPTDETGRLHPRPSERSSFWGSLNLSYERKKGAGKSTPNSLLARIDYGSELSAQLQLTGNRRTTVVYPSSGDIMRACRLRPGKEIIDATLYRLNASGANEAAYLVALLNAPCLSPAFAESRDSGRHFHLHPWRRVPIARFDQSNPTHVGLARLTVRAERIAVTWLARPEIQSAGLGQVGLSSRIRDLLHEKGVFAKIDRLARKILPDQASND